MGINGMGFAGLAYALSCWLYPLLRIGLVVAVWGYIEEIENAGNEPMTGDVNQIKRDPVTTSAKEWETPENPLSASPLLTLKKTD